MDLVEEFARLGKALKWKIYYFIGFSAQASMLGVFFDLNKYASGLGSTNLCEGFFGLIYPTKRIFEPTVLLLKKAARCQPFLAVVRCLFHNHLRLKRSSLLNVYLNYKFEFSLLTSHLFFSLFKKYAPLGGTSRRSQFSSLSAVFVSFQNHIVQRIQI